MTGTTGPTGAERIDPPSGSPPGGDAAPLIDGARRGDGVAGGGVVWHPGLVSPAERARVTGGPGVTVWLTGLSGAGKSTVAREVEAHLTAAGRAAYVLDGDNLRHGLCADLGFDAAARDENVRRTAEVACLFTDAGLVVIVALVSPYRAARQAARQRHLDAGLAFVEVHLDTPLDECRRRDPKGLYAASARGELAGLTGVDDPYEPPLEPELRLDGTTATPADLARKVISALR